MITQSGKTGTASGQFSIRALAFSRLQSSRSMGCQRSVSVSFVLLCSSCLREVIVGIINVSYPVRSTFLRLLTLAILAVVGALVLSGCSGGRGADSATAEERLVTIPESLPPRSSWANPGAASR